MKDLAEVRQATLALRQALNEAIEQHGSDLAVRLPFHPSYRPAPGETPSEPQAVMIRWRKALAQRNEALLEWLTWNGEARLSQLLPLVGYGNVPNFKTILDSQSALEMLDREAGVLAKLTKPSPVPQQLMTAEEVAQRTGLTKSRVYDLARRKQIPVIRLGRLMRFSREAIEEFLRKGR